MMRRCSFCRRQHLDSAMEWLRPEWGDPKPDVAGGVLWGCAPCVRKRARRIALLLAGRRAMRRGPA